MQVTDEFKKNIGSWIKLDEEEKKYKFNIKNIKDKKDQLEENILEYMRSNQIEHKDINLGTGGKLKYAQIKVQENITKKLIIDKLSKYFNDSDKAREITDFIYSDRKNDTKIYLKKID